MGDQLAAQATPDRRRLWLEVTVVLAVVVPIPLWSSVTMFWWPQPQAPSLQHSLYFLFTTPAWIGLVLLVVQRSGEPWSTFHLDARPRWFDPILAIALGLALAQAVEPALAQATQWLAGTEIFEQEWFLRADFIAPPSTPFAIAMAVLGALAGALAEELVFRA